MKRYIDADKLKAEIERLLKASELHRGEAVADGSRQTLYWIKDLITSLQQEQPEGGYSEKPNDLLLEQEPTCKTCDYYENDCPFTRGKLMVYPNKVCKDYTHSAMKQEQPEVNLEKEIDAYFDKIGMPVFWCNDDEQRDFCAKIARHFYELGKNARKEK